MEREAPNGFAPRLSRRRLLALGGLAAIGSICAAGRVPGAEARTPATSPGRPASTADVAAGSAAASRGKRRAGPFQVWFSANWNKVTDEAVGQIFTDWGKGQGVDVEWQAIGGSPAFSAKIAAAVAAGQPPELTNTDLAYWYAQGEMPAIDDLVNAHKDDAGGMYPTAVVTNYAPDGRIRGAPYGIDVWPVHWREDLIKPALGGRYFNSWNEVVEVGPKIQTPPRLFLFGMSLGHEGDHVNNIMNVLWDHGGRLNDEVGVPDIANPANRPGIELIVRLWQAKLIPPETFAQTITSWNNEQYQKSRAAMVINPATIMGWLAVNDRELYDKTELAGTPPGTAGAFSEASGIAFNLFKRAPLADLAPSSIDYFLRPDNAEKIAKAVEGRFLPIYRDQANTEFWSTGKWAEMKRLAEVGRVRNWPAPTQPWLTEVTESRFTLSDMINKIVNEGWKIEDAQDWAQREMMDVYAKFKT